MKSSASIRSGRTQVRDALGIEQIMVRGMQPGLGRRGCPHIKGQGCVADEHFCRRPIAVRIFRKLFRDDRHEFVFSLFIDCFWNEVSLSVCLEVELNFGIWRARAFFLHAENNWGLEVFFHKAIGKVMHEIAD